MQVQAVGINPQFTSRRHSRENIDTFINLDDNTIRNLALAQTNAVTDDRRHKRLDKAIFWSIPAVAGAAAAMLTKEPSNFLGVITTGRAAKLSNAVKSAGYWAGMFAVLDLAMYGINKITKNSSSLRKFDKNHPFLSTVATLGVGLGALELANRGVYKSLNMLSDKTFSKIQNSIVKIADKTNKNSILKAVEDRSVKLASKIYPAIKDTGKIALAWAPTAMLIGGIVHSINHSNVRRNEFVKNYTYLKDKQLEISQYRMDELKNAEEV